METKRKVAKPSAVEAEERRELNEAQLTGAVREEPPPVFDSETMEKDGTPIRHQYCVDG